MALDDPPELLCEEPACGELVELVELLPPLPEEDGPDDPPEELLCTELAELPPTTPQFAGQESPLSVLPSSQVSPRSTTPSPQRARRQLVRHALAVVLEFRAPLSHCSGLMTMLSPHTGPQKPMLLPRLEALPPVLLPEPFGQYAATHCWQVMRVQPLPGVAPIAHPCSTQTLPSGYWQKDRGSPFAAHCGAGELTTRPLRTQEEGHPDGHRAVPLTHCGGAEQTTLNCRPSGKSQNGCALTAGSHRGVVMKTPKSWYPSRTQSG